MANTYLTRTISSGGADLTKWTWSCWVKRTDLVGGGNNYQRLISNEVSGNTKSWYIRFQSSTQFHGWTQNGAFEFTTNSKYRDINGWYHLVVKYDSTQSTQSNRLKVYVNGEEPSMSAITYPSQNQICNFMNTGNYIDIGYYRQGSAEYFYGLMSHMHFTAGYAYDASAFGSTDSKTGEWKINTSPSVTYGSLGFFILKDGNSVTDSSTNSNNFTVGGGTLTKTEDNPSNVFATLNPLFYSSDVTFSNGNTTVAEGSNNWRSGYSQIGHSTGKYYAEAKITYQAGLEGYIGVAQEDHMNGTATYGGSTSGPNSGGYDYIGYSNKSVGVYSNGNEDYPSTVQRTGSFRTSGDIMGIAVDIPGNKFYLSKNGVWTNASNNGYGSTTFNASVGAISWTSKWTSGQVFVGCSPNESTWQWNFGNGHFGTTAVSSAGTNASGIGIFEYNVPTGFTAWSTKGLNL